MNLRMMVYKFYFKVFSFLYIEVNLTSNVLCVNAEHSTKVLNAITWNWSTSSRSPLSKSDFASSSKYPIDVSNSDFVEDCSMISGSHASTLERLLAWEKNLWEEVKVQFSLEICFLFRSKIVYFDLTLPTFLETEFHYEPWYLRQWIVWNTLCLWCF